MAIPVVFQVIAWATGIIGAGAAGKAVVDKSAANKATARGEATLEAARQALSEACEKANTDLAAYQTYRDEVLKGTLARVVVIADRVHAGEQLEFGTALNALKLPEVTIEAMRDLSVTVGGVMKTAAAAIGTGIAASGGAMAVAGAIGTASTGTAISALSGAAATNATLAYIGGGSIAAGGGGVAAGTAALTGLAVGPGIMVVGIAAAIKASEQRTEAERFEAKADVAAEQAKTEIEKMRAVGKRARTVGYYTRQLEERTLSLVERMEAVLAERPAGKVGFETLSDEEKDLYKLVLFMGTNLYALTEIDVRSEIPEGVKPLLASDFGRRDDDEGTTLEGTVA